MLDIKGCEIPVISDEALISDPPENEPDWEKISVDDCFDAPSLEGLSDMEKEKVGILKEMTKRIMINMQSRMKRMIEMQANLTDKDATKIIETIERMSSDKPRVTVRFGGEAVVYAEKIGARTMINAEEVRSEGLVVMQLPEPLAKYWYRKDSEVKKVNWGRIYEQLVDEFWQGAKRAKDEGLYLSRQNPASVHDPKNYYYVFSPSFENKFYSVDQQMGLD